MTETIINLETVNPIEFFGVNNGKLDILKKKFPLLKILSRGTQLKLSGSPEQVDTAKEKIDLIVQYLQLIHGPAFPPLRQASTDQALRGLLKFKKLTPDDGQALLAAYEFLRRMENRVRVVHGLSEHKLPQNPEALRKLAMRAGYEDRGALRAEEILQADYRRHSQHARSIFERIVGRVERPE